MCDSSFQFAAVAIIHKIRLQTESKRKALFLLVAKKLLLTLRDSKFSGAWNKKSTDLFYQYMGLTEEQARKTIEERELFLCAVGLIGMLNSINKTTGLKISHRPEVCLKTRQYLAIEYDIFDFLHLNEFHALVRELTRSSPNYGTSQNGLCMRLTLSLISLDGIVINNADGRIAGIEKEMIHLEQAMPMIQLPMQRKKGSQVKNFYLGSYSIGCMKILYQRAKNKGRIFPEAWLMTNAHHKKRERRIYLEQFLASLWQSVFPDRPVPDYLDADFWGKEARISMVLNGIPFVCLADLRNRLRGAQIPSVCVKANTVHDSVPLESEEDIGVNSFDRLKSLHALVRKHDDSIVKKMRLGEAYELKGEFQKALLEAEKAECAGTSQEDEATLIRWLIWMMRQKRFYNMRLSTFRGYISAVSNRVLPLPEGKAITEMGVGDWKKSLCDLATNEDYMPSSRRTAITHMRVLNEYLYKHKLAPRIDLSDYKYRVSRSTAECDVIFPHEVDEIIDSIDNENIKIAIILAFYCGLRCEEICFLTVHGLLDEYRLLVGRSKLPSSCRTFPYALFVPEVFLEYLRDVIHRRLGVGATWIISGAEDEPMPTWKLSKQVCRLLTTNGARVQKMHALRHGFASWQLVRYYMLVDKQFRLDIRSGSFCIGIDSRHTWFGDEMLTSFSEAMGGVPWISAFEQTSECRSNATDMMLISKLMGHASRFTTLENYTNTIGWISRYYLRRREHKLIGC